MNLARPVLLPIIPPARHKFHPQVTAAGWASADFEACEWSVRLSYLSARDIARLGPATQDTMVAHSVRNAKVFSPQAEEGKSLPTPRAKGAAGRLFFLPERRCAAEIASFSGSPLFSPGSPYYVIPALAKVDSERPMSGRHISGKRLVFRKRLRGRASALLLGAWVLAAAAPVCADPFRFPWDQPARQPTRPAPVQDRPLQEQQYPEAQQSLARSGPSWRARGRKCSGSHARSAMS
jgi:hypothetical protein